MNISTPVNATTDATQTLTGTTIQALQPDPYRAFLMLQAPAGAALLFSFTNNTVSAGATGCFSLAAASAPFIFGPNVPKGPLYVNGASGVAVILAGDTA